MEKWFITMKKADFNQISEKHHISPILARLIRNRDITGDEEIDFYLNGTIADLYDGMLMKDMDRAVEILSEKIREEKRIRVIGDYDIDGVNATYILQQGLSELGADADTDIPDRIKDGYGLNIDLIDRAIDDGIDTIITCDNGIAAAKEIAFAKELGMTVIVTDHHDIPYQEEADGSRTVILPPADVIVNPKQPDCRYPFKKLCGAAVAWRLAEALYREEGVPREEFLDLAEFAAVATVGDIMDLTGENRILVKYGLKRLEQTKNPGYRALLAVNGLEGKKLTAYHIGFVIGPCINASGRLDTARRALQLLGAETKAEAEELAGDLKALNDSRKDLTVKGTQQAVQMIEETDLKQDRVLVVYLPDCHESLAGIIAGRIREKYFRPCFVLTDAEDGVKGSGRSIPGYHMFDEMTRVRELFTKYGGHPMAAGLSLKPENVEPLRRALNENCALTEEELTPQIAYDAVLPICYAGEQIIRELELLEPFGKANEKPLFAAANLKVRSARIIGKNQNVLKAALEGPDGTRADTISFGDVQENLAYIEGKQDVCILYYPEINEYQGRRSVQLVVESWR